MLFVLQREINGYSFLQGVFSNLELARQEIKKLIEEPTLLGGKTLHIRNTGLYKILITRINSGKHIVKEQWHCQEHSLDKTYDIEDTVNAYLEIQAQEK